MAGCMEARWHTAAYCVRW